MLLLAGHEICWNLKLREKITGASLQQEKAPDKSAQSCSTRTYDAGCCSKADNTQSFVCRLPAVLGLRKKKKRTIVWLFSKSLEFLVSLYCGVFIVNVNSTTAQQSLFVQWQQWLMLPNPSFCTYNLKTITRSWTSTQVHKVAANSLLSSINTPI